MLLIILVPLVIVFGSYFLLNSFIDKKNCLLIDTLVDHEMVEGAMPICLAIILWSTTITNGLKWVKRNDDNEIAASPHMIMVQCCYLISTAPVSEVHALNHWRFKSFMHLRFTMFEAILPLDPNGGEPWVNFLLHLVFPDGNIGSSSFRFLYFGLVDFKFSYLASMYVINN
jgi:hypothetical protein